MTDHDFNGNESVIPSDIEYTLSRIGTIADSVDSSMTVGEIVRRAYLCGVGDTLDEFRKLVDRRTFARIPPSTGPIAIERSGPWSTGTGALLDAHASGARPSGHEAGPRVPGRLRIGAEVNA